jgi:hypothetical protein
MKSDEYMLGGHHFWVHFWCGLVFGGGFGAWMFYGLFDNWAANVGLTALIALVFALCCGRWGDAAWEMIGRLFAPWR